MRETMGEQSVQERAELLAQMAPHPSVSATALAGQDDGGDGSGLVNPPMTYLDDGEAPAYLFTNTKRGVALGTKQNRSEPADGRGTVILVTGRATLCIVGGESRDNGVRIRHQLVEEVTYHSGFLTNRLEIQTADRRYHCWIDRGIEDQHVEDATSYIRARMGQATEAATPEERPDDQSMHDPFASSHDTNGTATEGSAGTHAADEGEDSADESTVMYRGKPVDKSYLK
jgi:hypothetical protein